MASLASGNREVKNVLDIAETRRTGMNVALAGHQIPIDQHVRVYILHPDSNHVAERNLNNSSVVVKIVYGQSSLMLVGDAEVLTEQRLLRRYGPFLSSTMLKAGHHGSITSSSEEFLSIVHPTTALISVGIHNKFRHPSPFTVWRMKSHSIDIKRTDQGGAIIVENNGSGWISQTWR
jgi:competence protein ComEC